MRQRLTLCAAAGVFAAACGSSPAPPTPVVTGVTITSANSMVFIGANEQMTAAVTTNTGGGQTPVGTWGTDNASIATVSQTGLVTGVASGQVTIFFEASGGPRGTKLFRILPNYVGSWTGNYVVTNCTQSGTFVSANLCGPGNFTVGAPFQYAFNLTQTLDSVSGRIFLGTVQFDQTTGPVALSGELVLTSQTVVGTTRIDVAARVNSGSPGALVGSIGQNWTNTSVTGNASITGTISTSARTNSLPGVKHPQSLEEAVRLVSRR